MNPIPAPRAASRRRKRGACPGVLALLAALLPLPALARAEGPAPVADRPISDHDVEPYLKRIFEQFQTLQKNGQSPEDLLNEYARRSAGAKDPREQAILVHCRGTLLSALGRVPEARTEIDRSLRIFPRFPGSHVLLAALAMKGGDVETAEEHLRKALAIDPDHLRANLYLAQAYRMRAEKGQNPKSNLENAVALFRRTVLELESPTSEAWVGLSGCYLQLARLTYDEKQKKSYQDLALRMARNWKTDQPTNGQAHLNVARVQAMLGDYEGAAASLESSYKLDLPEEVKVAFLYNLLDFYSMLRKPDRIADALQRLLTHESVKGEQRAKAQKMLEDVKKNGSNAMLIWIVDQQLEILRNDGLSMEVRRDALQRLLEILTNPEIAATEGLEEVQRRVFAGVFRTALKQASVLTVDFLRWVRDMPPSPRLLRILVFFLYPRSEDWPTEVRVEAVRTIVSSAGLGGLIPLLYSLRDDDGAVLRATDQGLVRLCEQRSPVGEEITPLTAEQTKQLRRFWYRWLHGEDGSAALVASLAKLRECVQLDVTFNRENHSQPIVDALAQIVLLDGDLPFEAWKAGYDFFVDYMGKDLRPVDQRSAPVTPEQRADVMRAVAEWLSAPPPVEQPGGN